MASSMTGFGRGSIDGQEKSFAVEIKSVNHRYLDISIKMPRNLISLEENIRKIVSKKLSRGKVDIFITQNNFANNDVEASFNHILGDSYLKCLKEISDRYEVRDDISVSLIARFPDVITLNTKAENLEKVWEDLSIPINDALGLLVAMRAREGSKLKEDILKRCSYIKELVDNISAKSSVIALEYKGKLEKRLKELLGDIELDENRIAMEVAIYADKSNIDEELVRLYSHINQMNETLELNEPIGRKLDFIVQEMNREANTIASKTNDIELVNIVLNIKNEIEKIREQVQNVE